MIAIIDYNAGNITSVARALGNIGQEFVITDDTKMLDSASRVIFPGVGAAGEAMAYLKEKKLDAWLKGCFASGKPLMGICLGTQIILEHSEENDTGCIGLVAGSTRRFPDSLEDEGRPLKIPQMGWNSVTLQYAHRQHAGKCLFRAGQNFSGLFRREKSLHILRYYLTTHLIGWERDLFLITGIVSSAGKGSLKINDTCNIRFIKDGMAYGFETQIISVNLKPYPVMYFKYPTAIKQLTTRKFNRIKSNIPVRLLDSHDHFIVNATMTDLSMGGCGLNIPVREVEELAYEEKYKLEFSILETDMRLDCSVRVMTTVKENHFLGVEFGNMTSDEMATIDAFLDVLTNISASKVDAILSKLETSGATLGGHIDELPVSDVLQMMDQFNKEGVLNITSDQRNGFISISNGMIMDASIEDLTGADAIVELLSLKSGGFHFIAKEVTSGHLKRPISFMLIDACRIIDERNFIRKQNAIGTVAMGTP